MKHGLTPTQEAAIRAIACGLNGMSTTTRISHKLRLKSNAAAASSLNALLRKRLVHCWRDPGMHGANNWALTTDGKAIHAALTAPDTTMSAAASREVQTLTHH